MTTPVVLDCRHDVDGFYVIVRDDTDAAELYRTDQLYPSLQAAIHAACAELQPYERVADVLEVMEA